ncbi:MAG: S8 family serine peptidase [Actinobacteria bacterium]|nr:S8 family serine peptidase [Actinomycetota bacterium]
MPVVVRTSSALAVGGLLAASALAALPPRVSAVMAYEDSPVRAAGVELVSDLSAIREAVVRGTPAALSRLSRARGVIGLFPDDRVVLTGSAGSGTGVPAATGLGGGAGTRDAGRGVRVAVVDTGVSDTGALDRASGRLVDGFTVGGGFADAYGHGTFMASVIAGGPVDGSKGRPVGIAPAATVVVVKVADREGTTSLSDVVAGLDWLVRHADQVDVANLSFSHERPSAGYGGDPLNLGVEHVRAAGIVPVVAAGNDSDRVGDPGFDPQALTVGAADLTGGAAGVASFSGSAVVSGVRKPDVVANGVSVLGVLPPESLVAKAHPSARADGALWRGTGTSQATAVTSGLAAMFLQDHPAATPAQVKASLRAVADDLPGSRDGAGLADVGKKVVSGPDGAAYDGSGDATGEGSFDASSWSASSWSASSWSASSWSASSWSASSWSSLW